MTEQTTLEPSTDSPSEASGPTGAAAISPLTGLRNPGLSSRGVDSPRKHGIEDKLKARIAGLQQHLPPDQSFAVHGQALSVAQVTQAFQAVADLYAALTQVEQQAQLAITQARQRLNAELPTMQRFLSSFDNVLRGFYGTGNPLLASFGIASGARTPPTSLTQAQAAATATLTRAARHTRGKRQRLQITGGTAQVRLTGPDGTEIGAPIAPGPAPGARSPSTESPTSSPSTAPS